MSKYICILDVTQHSELESEIISSHISVGGHQVWEDTGTPVQYPILASNTRKRKWIDDSYYDLYFNDIAKKYPENIKFVDKNDSPSWGESWWMSGECGRVMLYKENWDSSD